MAIALLTLAVACNQSNDSSTQSFEIRPPRFPKPTPDGTAIPPLATYPLVPETCPGEIMTVHPSAGSQYPLSEFYGLCVSFDPQFVRTASYSSLAPVFKRELKLSVNGNLLSLDHDDLLEVEVNAGIGPICRMVPPVRERICWPANLMAGHYRARLNYASLDGTQEFLWSFTLTE
jgi:hypothetical protein